MFLGVVKVKSLRHHQLHVNLFTIFENILALFREEGNTDPLIGEARRKRTSEVGISVLGNDRSYEY